MPGYEIDRTFIAHPSTSRNRPYPVSKLLTSLSFRQEEHAENVLKRMQDYMECRKFCDVILVAGTDGKRVSAHRLILAATSEYFANLFSTKTNYPSPMEFEENESEMEEELNTKSLQEDSDKDTESEEVIIVGLMRRKGNEDDEEFVTMKGRLQLKSKHEDSTKCCFKGVLNRGSRLEEEEVEELKCSKNFYNQECKKLEEQELPHCLELEPGQYFRKYPEIVSQEINSRVVKSIDALCLEAKVDKNETAKSPAKDAIRASENTAAAAAENYFFTEPPQKKEPLDPLVTKQAALNNADSLLVKTLKSSLKKNEEKNVDSRASSADSMEKCRSKKEVRIAEDCKKRQVSDKVDFKFCCGGKDRMKGGGNDTEATTDSDKVSILPCSSTYSKSTRVQKQEIKNQKQLRALSHAAEFDLKQNDKPLRLSLRYESKDKEILLTGTLSSKDDMEANKYKLRRIGGEVLKQQFEKNKSLTVKEFLSKTNVQESLSAARALHTETKLEGALKENSDFRFVNQNGVKNRTRYGLAQAQKQTEAAAKVETSENTTSANSEEASEVWEHDDLNDANTDKPKPQPPKKPKKDRLINLRRKFERKDKTSSEDMQQEENLEKQVAAKILYKSKEDSSDKLVTRQESKLGKIKEKFRSNFFSAQSSKREGVCAKKTDELRQSSSNTTATVQRHSSVEIKRVSIEYVAEEAEVDNIIPCNWLRCSKQDINDINYSKALGAIAEEDEHSSMEPKSDKSSIEIDELKLLHTWNCASEEKEKSSEPLVTQLDTVAPPNLDKFDISRKPISNIAKKHYDNRTLSELFRDLIKVETQEHQSRGGKGQINADSILDSFLRESLEEHAAAMCSDLRLQQKVNQKTKKAAKVVQPEIEKEIVVVVKEPETEKAVELSTSKEPIVKEPTDKEPTDKEPTEHFISEYSIDDDEAITAMVGPQSSAHEEVVFKEEPIVEVEIPLKKAMPLEMTEELAIPKRNLRVPENLTIETEQCHETIFKSEKYWYTPKTPKKAALEEIILDNVDGNALELLINFCYSGNIEFQEENIARNVLATAALLQLDSIVHECSNYLARKLHPSNCVSVINFAQEQNYQRLYDESKDYACRHFTEVCKYNEFYHLTANQLAQILSSDELNLPSEEEVFNCIVAWVQHDRDNRHADLPLLLPQLRLALMQPSFILKHVEPVFANSNTDCHRLVIEALKWHLLPSSDRDLSATQLSDFSLKPRKSKVQWHHNIGELLAVGYNISEKTITLECYSASLNKWSISKRKRLLPGRKGYGVAVLENLLLVIGGYEDWDGAKALRTVLGLDLQSLNWMTLEPMKECRYGASVVLLNGFVYVMGGGDYYRTGFLRSVERWDSETYTWATVEEMSTKRIFAGAVVLDNMLYVVGGSNEFEYLNTMERYDPYKDEWSIMAPMSESRCECGVAAAHGYIYVVGGFANGARSNTVERYNPIANIWSRVCSVETARSCCSCAALGNRLLALGGYDENGISLRSVEEYNINMDQWEPFPALTSRYFSLFVLTVLSKPKLAKFFKYGVSSPKMNTLGQLCHYAVRM